MLLPSPSTIMVSFDITDPITSTPAPEPQTTMLPVTSSASNDTIASSSTTAHSSTTPAPLVASTAVSDEVYLANPVTTERVALTSIPTVRRPSDSTPPSMVYPTTASSPLSALTTTSASMSSFTSGVPRSFSPRREDGYATLLPRPAPPRFQGQVRSKFY